MFTVLFFIFLYAAMSGMILTIFDHILSFGNIKFDSGYDQAVLRFFCSLLWPVGFPMVTSWAVSKRLLDLLMVNRK